MANAFGTRSTISASYNRGAVCGWKSRTHRLRHSGGRWMDSITTIQRLKDEINHLLPELGGTKRVKLTDLKIGDTVMLRGFRRDEVSSDLDFGSRSPFLAGKRG